MRRIKYAASLVAIVIAQGTAFAQDAAGTLQASAPQGGEASSPLGGDIVVTARRREESLQKVPLAITAVTGKMLEQMTIQTATDLTRVAPSLLVASGSASGANLPQLTIRGQRQGNFGPAYDPAVGVYLGDIVFQTPVGFNQSLFDLQNVQVLKGPQGTLFGRNTTGGAILLQPNLPTDERSFSGKVGYGNYNQFEIEGAVNLPLGEKAQLRIAGRHMRRDGYVHDLATGRDDANENGTGVRVSLRLAPTDTIENVTVGNYFHRDVNALGFRLANIIPGSTSDVLYPNAQAVLARARSLGFYNIETGPAFNSQGTSLRGFAKARTYTIANTTSIDLNDDIKIKNIVGYITSRTAQLDDLDGSPLPLVTFGTKQREHQFSEEFQLLGDTGNLNWIAGAYYFRQKARYRNDALAAIEPFLPIIPDYDFNNDLNTSKSLFASGTYAFTSVVSGLSATLGARYTWDKRIVDLGTVYAVGTPGVFCAFDLTPAGVNYKPLPDCSTHQEVKFGKLTYNASLDYTFAPDKLVYIAHRKGYRSGGFNVQATQATQLIPFRPEIVNDYELGLKLSWHFDNGMFLRTNAAIYEQNYRDIQKIGLILLNGIISNNIQNAASAKIRGAELEMTFVPDRHVELSGFFNYTKPSYNKYLSTNLDGSQTDVTKIATFAGVPRHSMGITGRFTIPASESLGVPVLQANFYRQSSYDQNDYVVPVLFNRIPKYSLLNLRAELNKVGGSDIDIAFFMNNALKKKYLASLTSNEATLGFVTNLPAPPRMFGVQLSFNFGS